jgi:hypothetical protein
MTIFEYLNLNKNQALTFDDERFYAYKEFLYDFRQKKRIPPNLRKNQSLVKQLNIRNLPLTITDNNNILYFESARNYWYKKEFNEAGQETYYMNSRNFWAKREYDANNNVIKYEDSDNYWYKREFNENGQLLYHENSKGEWEKYEYDNHGNQINYKNSKQ